MNWFSTKATIRIIITLSILNTIYIWFAQKSTNDNKEATKGITKENLTLNQIFFQQLKIMCFAIAIIRFFGNKIGLIYKLPVLNILGYTTEEIQNSPKITNFF